MSEQAVTSTSRDPDKKLRADIYALDFGVEKSMRYHQRRKRFFDWWHRGIMFLVIFSGSAAFANLADFQQWFALATALLGALDLVFAFSHRARDHDNLNRRFTELAVKIRESQKASEETYKAWITERLRIEADEPPTLWALEASCYNEVIVAWHRESCGMYRLKPWHHVMMNFWPFEKVELEFGPPKNATASPPRPTEATP